MRKHTPLFDQRFPTASTGASRATMWLSSLMLLGLASSCAVRAPTPGPQDRYLIWLGQGHRADADAYAATLRNAGVGDVVPMFALTRSARSWRECAHDEFNLPPPELHANMVPTLQLLLRLKTDGLIDTTLARSVYRPPDLNTCAGGSQRSRHLHNQAIDFDLPARADNVEKLCAFWREHGPAANMGLGFYTPTAIHIDTAGFRTWGEDHSKRTSLCLTPAEKAAV
ncbi:MAG: peptidase M15 [Lysobacteraceae bacterium]|nr:MAG: peptidase M15 [Xanthomonadaceae bacterium]